MATTEQRKGQSRKSIEEVVSYAVGHPIRAQVLVLLNEGTYTAGELAALVNEPLNKVSNHICKMLDEGAIELAESRQVGNITRHYYRAVETPYYSKEDFEAMTPEYRQITWGFLIQTMFAEVMAALWARTIDPSSDVQWDWRNLDAQGRKDLIKEQERSWDRMCEIEVEAFNRTSVSGEETRSFIVGQLGFPRARTAPRPPDSP